MSVPDISVEVAKKVTAIGQEMKSRATRGSRALKNAELQVLRGQRGGRSYKKSFKKQLHGVCTGRTASSAQWKIAEQLQTGGRILRRGFIRKSGH